MSEAVVNLLDKLGPPADVARGIGVPLSRLQKWRARKRVPGGYWKPIERFASEQGEKSVTVAALADAHEITLPLKTEADLAIPDPPSKGQAP